MRVRGREVSVDLTTSRISARIIKKRGSVAMEVVYRRYLKDNINWVLC